MPSTSADDRAADSAPTSARAAPPRAYRSPQRLQQAERTRRAIEDAAAPLFARQGYAQTTVRQIARSAGVSVETIYASGDKRSVFLRAFELSLRGDLAGTALLDLEALTPARDAADLDVFLRTIVRFVVDANARTSRLWAAFVEGANTDPVLAASYSEQMTAMRVQARRVLDHAVEAGLCDRPADPASVVDVIWATLHPGQYELLVREAGWAHERYKAWLVAFVRRALEGF